MHLLMLLLGVGLACSLRLVWSEAGGRWHDRWQRSLERFVFPPLLLLMITIAIVWMGPNGTMLHWHEGWISYGLAIVFLAVALLVMGRSLLAAWISLRQIRTYPECEVAGHSYRLLDSSFPFIARIGFWRSELVISRGLLEMFGSAHLQAVLVHEQAHAHYYDTVCFLGLGWLRRLTAWLPQTEALWQELLLLRELRADRWAAQQVDPLLLAEALLTIVRAPLAISERSPEYGWAAFSSAVAQTRLQARIEAILAEPEPNQPTNQWHPWFWLLLSGLPLLLVPFHS
jgi:Zn-dependent protease with chaperone function